MAVAAGFEITSSHPTSLTVVGDGSVKTEYGSYWFNLGPGAGREYHEISCVEMNSVTQLDKILSYLFISQELLSLLYPV